MCRMSSGFISLSLHDALPISGERVSVAAPERAASEAALPLSKVDATCAKRPLRTAGGALSLVQGSTVYGCFPESHADHRLGRCGGSGDSRNAPRGLRR